MNILDALALILVCVVLCLIVSVGYVIYLNTVYGQSTTSTKREAEQREADRKRMAKLEVEKRKYYNKRKLP